MSKELEALNKIQHDFGQLKGQELVNCYETIFNGLKRLEQIDNANSSEALECLKELRDFRYGKDKLLVCQTQMYNTIKQTLLKVEEQDFNYKNIIIPFFDELVNVLGTNDVDEMLDKIKEQKKVLEIIKEKNVDIWLLKSCLTVEQYNYSITKIDNCKVFNLTQDEFDLLKRWLGND